MKNEEIIKEFEEELGFDETSLRDIRIKDFLRSALEIKDKEIIKWAERMLEDKEISNGYYNAMNDLIKFLNKTL